MSLPSIPMIAQELGFDLENLQFDEREQLLVAAMKRDLREAVDFLHQKAHTAKEVGAGVVWVQNPNSVIGKQLIRLHASDPLRRLASKYFCHDQHLTFVNCCGGKIGGDEPKEEELQDLQIKMQAGPIAYADC